MQHISELLKKVLVTILNARAKRVFGEDTHVIEYYRDHDKEYVNIIIKGNLIRIPVDDLFGGEDEKAYN